MLHGCAPERRGGPRGQSTDLSKPRHGDRSPPCPRPVTRDAPKLAPWHRLRCRPSARVARPGWTSTSSNSRPSPRSLASPGSLASPVCTGLSWVHWPLLGALVQPRPAPQPLPGRPTSRVRSSVLRCPTARPHRGWDPIERASIRPRVVQYFTASLLDPSAGWGVTSRRTSHRGFRQLPCTVCSTPGSLHRAAHRRAGRSRSGLRRGRPTWRRCCR